MPDPVLNEKAVMQVLDKVASVQSAERLVSGAFMSAVDCFDRRINREPFMEVLQDAFGLADMLSRLDITAAYKDHFAGGTMTDAMFDSSIKEITGRAEKLRESLIKRMDLVVQCPYEDDKKH